MRITESRALRRYLKRYPKDWSFKQIIDHLRFEDGVQFTARDTHEYISGDELADLIVRHVEKLEEP